MPMTGRLSPVAGMSLRSAVLLMAVVRIGVFSAARSPKGANQAAASATARELRKVLRESR
jgi:hypothetical protein